MDEQIVDATSVPDFNSLSEEERLELISADYLEKSGYTTTYNKEWIIQGLIKPGLSHLLLGKPQRGKSLIADQMAICISSGKPFLNKFPVKKGKVVLIDEDTPTEVLTNRLERFANCVGRDLESLPLEWQSLTGWKLTPRSIADLARKDADLVILDTISAISSGNLNQTVDAAEASRLLTQLKKTTTILTTHHLTLKENEDDLRLLSSSVDCTRWAMGNTMLIGHSDTAFVTLQVRKNEFVIRPIPRRIPLDIDNFGIKIFEDEKKTFLWLLYESFHHTDRHAKLIVKLFQDHPNDFYTVKSAMEATGAVLSDWQLRDALRDLLASNHIEMGREHHNRFKYTLKKTGSNKKKITGSKR